QTLSFAPLKEVKPGETQVYEVFATAVKAGDARWKTVLTADQLTAGPVTEQESTNIFRDEDSVRPMPPGLQTGRTRAKY
ncbi:MAG TPA: hypothetical protein VE988_22980, partial [Gemmataceae bacterium]|nr:hypothetical protein [Gemmataceae bacterium]